MVWRWFGLSFGCCLAVAISGFACVDLLAFGFVLLFIVFCKLDCVAELIMFCGFIDSRFAAVRLGLCFCCAWWPRLRCRWLVLFA